MKRYKTKLEFINAEQFLIEDYIEKWKDYIEVRNDPYTGIEYVLNNGIYVFDRDYVYFNNKEIPVGVARERYFIEHYEEELSND